MSDDGPSNRRWEGLLLVPFGLVAVGLGVFLLYQNFLAPQPLVSGGVVFAVMALIVGVVGTVVGVRRLVGRG